MEHRSVGTSCRYPSGTGPAQINSENGLLEVSVLMNARGRDAGSVIADADKAIRARVKMPPGYYYNWSGQFENEVRAKKRLQLVVPIAIGIIYVLLYLTYRSFVEAAHVLLAVPFALTGGLYLLWLLHYNFSVAVWVGFIALFGTAVQTTVCHGDLPRRGSGEKTARTGSADHRRPT